MQSLELASTQLAISWLNSLLYSVELVLASYYLSHYTCRTSLKCLISGIVVIDGLLMITNFASAWVVLIRDDPVQDYNPRTALWTVPLSTFLLATLAVTQELLLVNRFHALSQAILPSVGLLLLIAAHAILSLFSGFYVITHTALDPNFQRFGNRVSMVLAAVASLVDVVIPAAVTCRLYRVSPRRERSYRAMAVNAVSCGGVGGVMRFILFVLFFEKPGVFYILANLMGRIYVLTILVNLLIGRQHTPMSPEKIPKHLSYTLSDLNAMALARAQMASAQSSIYSFPDKELPPLPAEV